MGDIKIYADPYKTYLGQEIGNIPFKEKVEIIGSKKVKVNDDSFTKIKYKDTVGYVNSTYLSERTDIPFVDRDQYDYSLNEFEYDKRRVIDSAQRTVIKDSNSIKDKLSLSKIFFDDPYIYSFYGKNCNGEDERFIFVIMISKLHKDLNHYIFFTTINEREYGWYAYERGLFKDDETIKEYIEVYRKGGECP